MRFVVYIICCNSFFVYLYVCVGAGATDGVKVCTTVDLSDCPDRASPWWWRCLKSLGVSKYGAGIKMNLDNNCLWRSFGDLSHIYNCPLMRGRSLHEWSCVWHAMTVALFISGVDSLCCLTNRKVKFVKQTLFLSGECTVSKLTSVQSVVFRPSHRPTIVLPFVYCKSLFTNNMVDDKKQREITEKLN